MVYIVTYMFTHTLLSPPVSRLVVTSKNFRLYEEIVGQTGVTMCAPLCSLAVATRRNNDFFTLSESTQCTTADKPLLYNEDEQPRIKIDATVNKQMQVYTNSCY